MILFQVFEDSCFEKTCFLSCSQSACLWILDEGSRMKGASTPGDENRERAEECNLLWERHVLLEGSRIVSSNIKLSCYEIELGALKSLRVTWINHVYLAIVRN